MKKLDIFIILLMATVSVLAFYYTDDNYKDATIAAFWGNVVIMFGVAFLYFLIKKCCILLWSIGGKNEGEDPMQKTTEEGNTKMNKKQRMASIVTISFMLLMLVIPPYIIVGNSHLVKETGYSAIFHISEIASGSYAATINYSLLVVQEGIVFVCYIMLLALFHTVPKRNIDEYLGDFIIDDDIGGGVPGGL